MGELKGPKPLQRKGIEAPKLVAPQQNRRSGFSPNRAGRTPAAAAGHEHGRAWAQLGEQVSESRRQQLLRALANHYDPPKPALRGTDGLRTAYGPVGKYDGPGTRAVHLGIGIHQCAGAAMTKIVCDGCDTELSESRICLTITRTDGLGGGGVPTGDSHLCHPCSRAVFEYLKLHKAGRIAWPTSR